MTKKKAIIIAVAAIAAIAIIVLVVNSVSKVDYWDLKAGDKTVAVFSTEEEAEAVIAEVEGRYVKKDAEVKSLEVTPALTVVKTTYKKKEAPKPEEKPKKTADYLLKGEKAEVTYTVKEGDTIWDIAYKHDMTISEIEKINPDVDMESIYPGDKLVFSELDPIVDVQVVQLVTSTKKIKYEKVERKTSKLTTGTQKVKQKGKNGKKRVTELITSVNGKTTKTEVKKSKVLKKPKKEIILVGTGDAKKNSDGATYNGSGQAVADFALQYVGNPYEYGGTSLTDGADCSGFVMAVYDHFGVSLPHGAVTMQSYGRGVSLSEAQPGDLICYPAHVAIYIGGGQIVHAIDYGYGIGVTGLNYSGNPVVDVRRIFE
ncbi:MAG: C40 family peptidase [Firmicutes bacterium]|nr:C40 family peptidase [Bacillota bacterium]